MKIKYPIEVNGIVSGQSKTIEDDFEHKVGELIRIQPCSKDYEGKTFLGIYMGRIAKSNMVSYNQVTKELSIEFCLHNPAIFVPDLNKIIYGYESWWSKIDSMNDLKDITNEEIQNVWYVRALKQISEMGKKDEKP